MSSSKLTKKAIAAELKDLCRKKSFDKISISDITEQCGLNRQTFYYHFEDKYELLNWIYLNEVFAEFIEDISLDNWDQHFQRMMEQMVSERSFYFNTVTCDPKNFMDFIYKISHTLFTEAIAVFDPKGRVEDEKRDFYASFYSHGSCGILLDWVNHNMKAEPEHVASMLKFLAEDSKRLGFKLSEESGTPLE